MIRLTPIIVAFALAGTVLGQEPSPGGAGLRPRVKMETSAGDIVLELDAEKAPLTVANFIRYAEEGFYNGTVFHRVISTFMIQGGGYTPEMDEKKQGLHAPIKNEAPNGLKNERGSIAMARTQDPDSATAQFYINVVDNMGGGRVDLDTMRYAVFGKVVEGMETVDKIRDAKVIAHPKYPAGQAVTPEEPIVIKSVKVVSEFDREALKKKVAEAEAAREKAQAEAGAAREKAIADAVKKIEAETGKTVQKTPSGLRYVVLQEGSGASPKPTDTVELHYSGWLVDGTKFESSVDRGQPITHSASGFVPGFNEGIAMMKVGEKRKLIIPSDLAYGARGRPGIPPDATLIFEIELLAIK